VTGGAVAPIVVLASTAVWHALAAWHFAFFPQRTLERTTRERPVSPVACELFRFLGAINVGFVVLALAAIARPEARPVAYVALAVANFSQFVVDLRVQRMTLAKGPMFKQILVGDSVFTLLNVGALVLLG
jgi:hypothetical protein